MLWLWQLQKVKSLTFGELCSCSN